ncbi:uncharacterized protein METZ01_LOCUS146159, partial [marine metagenome]
WFIIAQKSRIKNTIVPMIITIVTT